jgi:hypothetical protein
MYAGGGFGENYAWADASGGTGAGERALASPSGYYREGFGENYAWVDASGGTGAGELALASPSGYYREGFGVLPTVIPSALSLAGSIFKSSAAGPNKDAAQQVYPEAAAGNLAAIAAFITRAGIHTVSSAAPWQAGLASLQADHPDWVSQAQPLSSWAIYGAIPPEQVLSAVMAHAQYVNGQGAGPGAVAPMKAAGIPGGPVGLVLIAAVAFMALRGRR